MFGFIRRRKAVERGNDAGDRIRQLKEQLAAAKEARNKLRAERNEIRALMKEERRHRRNAEARLARLETDLETAEQNPLPGNLPWPLPPLRLRARVAGYWAGHTFIETGIRLRRCVEEVLDAAGEDRHRFRHVLDWGCGCGRLLRELPGVFPNARFTGVDIDAEAIAWDAAQLRGLAEFAAVPDHPPSALPSQSFDFILGLSVFTHLPLELETAWLSELARLAAPGALLLLTYHGTDLLSEYFTLDQALQQDRGFSYFRTSPTAGLPDYYQASFHSEDSLRRLWGEHFEIRAILPKSIGNRQGAVLCSPRT